MRLLTERDAVLAVDVQRDFCGGGRLAVTDGDAVVDVLNPWIERAKEGGALVVASRDWHPPDHVSFQPYGGTWPVHCVQRSEGAEFHPRLNLPDDAWIVSKGNDPAFDQYSAFDRTGLADRLKSHRIERLWVGGLAMDVCVKATVCDACEHGFETHLIRPATRAVNVKPGDDARALDEMRQAGAIFESF